MKKTTSGKVKTKMDQGYSNPNALGKKIGGGMSEAKGKKSGKAKKGY